MHPAKSSALYQNGVPFPRRSKLYIACFDFLLFQVAKHRTDIDIEQNGLRFKPFHAGGLVQIDTGIGGPGILRCHAQEWHFDDAGGIAADAEFQTQDAAVHMVAQKFNDFFHENASNVFYGLTGALFSFRIGAKILALKCRSCQTETTGALVVELPACPVETTLMLIGDKRSMPRCRRGWSIPSPRPATA